MKEAVRIHEVGPRDGLQNEPGVIALADRIALIDLLSGAGLAEVEIGSFVNPRRVPQMADTAAVMAGIRRDRDCDLTVLVPNMQGWRDFRLAAAAAPAARYRVAVFISASEGFSRANLNCSVAESLTRLAPVVAAAQAAGVALRGYVSCVTDCPFDGPVAPEAVAQAVAALRALAPMPVSLGDTIGKGRPKTVAAMLARVLEVAPARELAGHFHDTGGWALANVEAALDLGLRDFDSAVGGLGGCPFAPGAPGNLATEALIARMEALGIETGADHDRIALAAELARNMRGAA